MSVSCLAETHLESNFDISWVHPSCWHICCLLAIPLAAAANTYIQDCNQESTHWIRNHEMKQEEMRGGGGRGTWTLSTFQGWSFINPVVPIDMLIKTENLRLGLREIYQIALFRNQYSTREADKIISERISILKILLWSSARSFGFPKYSTAGWSRKNHSPKQPALFLYLLLDSLEHHQTVIPFLLFTFDSVS